MRREYGNRRDGATPMMVIYGDSAVTQEVPRDRISIVKALAESLGHSPHPSFLDHTRTFFLGVTPMDFFQFDSSFARIDFSLGKDAI